MTVAFDAITSSTATSFTHTPVGTPRGVLVLFTDHTTLSDRVSSVTYGGVSCSEVALSPLTNDGTDNHVIHGFFLGSSVPTGAQTVAYTSGGGTQRIDVVTFTAAADTEVKDTSTVAETTNGTGARTVTLSLGGEECACVVEFGTDFGAVTSFQPLTNWTSRRESDEGTNCTGFYTYDIVGTSDVSAGVDFGANSGQLAALCIAIGEVAAGGGRTGSMAATESGADDATAAGEVDISGVVAAVEAGADDATMAGEVDVQGDLDATETGADTFAGTGTVDDGNPPITGTMDATETGGDTFAGNGAGTGVVEQPTGGWDMFADVQRRERMRRRREEERAELALTEQEQRRLDRAATKIARRIAREGLNASRPAVMAAPAFDALLTALRPNEGQALALADAIVQRVLWMAEAQQADEESALMALLMEL